jgi:multidrug efflux pump subunit AcrA (membrane-fusion protein)
MDEASQRLGGVEVAPVLVRSLARSITVPAQVVLDEQHTQHLGVLADGRVESVSVVVGDPVRRGQTLAVVHSHAVHETVAALAQAFAAVRRQQSAVAFATQTRDRYQKLYGIQAAALEEKQRSEQDLAQASKDLADAEATLRAEREHLAELLQVPAASLTPDNLYHRELVPIRAVADGVVLSRSVTVGQVVSTGEEAFVTSSLASVWVNASVNEKDVPLLRRGAAAVIEIAGQPEGVRGTVALLGDMLDPQTRTLPVRIVVLNRGLRLRPGMFVQASIAAPSSRSAVFIPASALQAVNGLRVVFVPAEQTAFSARTVETGAENDGLVEVTKGLAPSDRVVVKGAFMVKSQMLKGAVDED